MARPFSRRLGAVAMYSTCSQMTMAVMDLTRHSGANIACVQGVERANTFSSAL